MSNGKIKIFKNSDRSKAETRKQYVPQYQLMGIEPEELKSAVVSNLNHSVVKAESDLDNPRLRRPAIRQPYAKISPSPVGRGRGPVPNVGNNMEHTWSSVDGEIIDDISEPSFDEEQLMIDNNDYVSDAALGHPSYSEDNEELPILDEVLNPQSKKFMTQKELESVIQVKEDDIQFTLQELQEEDCLLLVNGTPICSGPSLDVEEQARLLVFGEHELCDGNPIPVDDIIVVKRLKIKIGLFLD